ncbi:hypothetical protein N8368_04275, partial [Bacteroidia bacterium]|nr:hypothetical protein [Bacteroidia bacterium]
MIYILAGDVRSGKTNALEEWIGTWDNVKGILCPDNDADRRYLYNIETGENHTLEVDEPSENTFRVGKFHFLQESMMLANYILKPFCSDIFYSINSEQNTLELPNTVIDVFEGEGPLGGIISSMRTTQKSIMIVAVDMPLVST